MSEADDILYLAELVDELRSADPGFRVFGSETHQYRFGERLCESAVKDFEQDHRVALPSAYRQFLISVGNGGAGPYYGLLPLSAGYSDLTKPFPFTEGTENLSSDELDAYRVGDDFPGILEICHRGSGIHFYLVVRGPTAGSLWEGREDYYATGLGFLDWYRMWAERALRTLANQPCVTRLKPGMSMADVVSETDDSWKLRTVESSGKIFFEAPEIPAQLELDGRGTVVGIRPWLFL